MLAGVPGDINFAVAPSGHMVTFTNAAGLATEADFETALAQVEYDNSSDKPNTTVREVQVVATDDQGAMPTHDGRGFVCQDSC